MRSHLETNVLARLAENNWSGLADSQKQHLRECQDCRDAIVEIAAATATMGRQPMAAPASLRHAILDRTSRRRTWAQRLRRPALVGLPAAAVLALVMVTVTQQPATIDHDLINPVGRVLASRSVNAMVFPGVLLDDEDRPRFRGGQPTDDEIAATVSQLTTAYNSDPGNPCVARWLLGAYLAVDDLRTAQLFARDAVRRHGDDSDLLAAAAIVWYRSGDYAQADRLLTAAADRASDQDVIRLNRALLKRATHHHEQAEVILRELVASEPSPIASRAASLLRHRPATD